MQSTMINSTLLNNWNPYKNSFNADLHEVETYGIYPNYDYNHYLFLKRELGVTAENWKDAKDRGIIRHCKIYQGKFFDYIVAKEFDTIEDWVKDAGGKMEDVIYGENRIHKGWCWKYDVTTGRNVKSLYTAKYVELNALLKALGYVEPPKVSVSSYQEKCEKLTSMLEIEMGMRGLSISRVYVLDEADQLVPWKTFIDQ